MSTFLDMKITSLANGPIPHTHDAMPIIAHIKNTDLWVSGYFNKVGEFFSDIDETFHENDIDYFFEIPDKDEIKNI